MTTKTDRADLVFEGGGVKGIGLAGAYSELRKRGIAPMRVAGTSAGAIMAALIAVGYEAEELAEIVPKMPYKDFMDRRVLGHVPLLGEPLELLRHRGLYKGDAFLEWMKERLAEKGKTTFGDLAKDPDDPKNPYPLRVIASDLTGRALLTLPNDAKAIGIEPDDLGIAEAVRMSMSIPFFFEPVVAADHTIVDGGVLSNFPVWLFDSHGATPRWPTFGLLLVEPEPEQKTLGDRLPKEQHHADSVVSEILDLAHTMMEAHDRLYVSQANYARTIPIPTLGVGTTEFDISPDRVAALFESGRAAAADFLDHRWDFDAYISQFRRGEVQSRSAGLEAVMSPEG